MKKLSFLRILVICLLVFLLAGCTPQTSSPAQFGAAPWQDGEVSTYDVIDSDESIIGVAEWVMQYEDGNWKQSYRMEINGRVDSGEVVMGENLVPLSSIKQSPDKTVETVYTGSEVLVTITPVEGEVTSKTIEQVAGGYDNDQLLMIHRALPLAMGLSASYTDIIPTSGTLAPTTVSISSEEEQTVPAGVMNTWHIVMDFSSVKHDAWYSTEAPYLMVRYRNQNSGVEFRLRSWRLGEGLSLQGNQEGVELPEDGTASTEMPPVNRLQLALILLVQYPLMLVFPVVLGWWLRRRYGLSWRLFFAGGLIFVASQGVHLPLNWALGLLGGGRGAALLPLPLMALVAGLSAGVCEECARWVGLRFYLRKQRNWQSALQIGAGHGGIEALLLGALAVWGTINILLVQSVGIEGLGLSGDAAAQTLAAVKSYWNVDWYLPVFAGLERLFAITAHVFMTVLVMRSFTRRNLAYLWAAIGFHALLDAWAVWAAQTLSSGWVELGVAVFAAFSFWMILRLKDPQKTVSSNRN